ncbi:hypothetical protein TSOC_010093 [Tetrabaena socialis]|uniref:Uncharacterized protein n=1 Tax=Tetrabaena socialis TaxID=47790 RepID=A0A2J7ZU79_9CHLO|nr:hypothetical protein TSOC_010093 [Tetrabaena socialis]|eukprot:PNH03824.1 hypothetical protein TSOC_010093 [Tetrabaena socialis]
MASSLAGTLLRWGSALGSNLGGALSGAQQELARGVQQVVTVLEPGPLGGRLGRWENAKQAAAEEQVQRAVERFAELQPEQQQQQQRIARKLRACIDMKREERARQAVREILQLLSSDALKRKYTSDAYFLLTSPAATGGEIPVCLLDGRPHYAGSTFRLPVSREMARGVQRVVTVLEPGPLGSRLGRWENAKQAAAEEQVQRAIECFAGAAAAAAMIELARGVQQVVTVLEPGPLGGRLGRWENAKQAAAEEQVQRAVERFAELQPEQQQ